MTRPATLVCYISGHGFGHAVRTIEVVRALRAQRPACAVHVRTTVPQWFVAALLDGPFTYAPVRLDVGAVQRDSLSLDTEATLQAATALSARTPELVASEVATLRPLRPTAVFADIPAPAFQIAAQLGAPAIGMSNFSWDWIYADYVQGLPAYASVVEELRAAYARATLLLRLPFHGDLSAFPCIRDIPLVARHARLLRGETRRRLGLPADDRVVVLSFGGIGVELEAVPPAPPGVTFVATQSAAGSHRTVPGCRFVSNADLGTAQVRYEDLVAAADVVMTKPGYGIVADCIANGTAMIYTPRGRFAEYEHLVRGIERYVAHAFIGNDDLYAGRWSAALEAAFAAPPRTTAIDTTGAAVAAGVLAAALDGQPPPR